MLAMFYPYIKDISLEYLEQHQCGRWQAECNGEDCLGIERQKSGKDVRWGKLKPAYTTEDVDRTVALSLTGPPTCEVAVLVGLSPTQVATIVMRAGVSRERMAATNLMNTCRKAGDAPIKKLTWRGSDARPALVLEPHKESGFPPVITHVETLSVKERPMHHYGDNFLLVLADTPLLHTQEHPFCGDPTCPCYEDEQNKELITLDDAAQIMKGKTV
jgi:hypothetical protein